MNWEAFVGATLGGVVGAVVRTVLDAHQRRLREARKRERKSVDINGSPVTTPRPTMESGR